VFRVVVVLTSGSLAGCSVLPEQTAPDSALPIYRITGAVTAGAGRPEIADSKPTSDQGELRFVVVPRGQGGIVRAR
jgi:hypothetical protein